MTVIVVVRVVTALAFLAAFFGMARNWERRGRHLTAVGRRQYANYYGFILIGLTAAVVGSFDESPGLWLDYARLVLAGWAAWALNWRLAEEDAV